MLPNGREELVIVESRHFLLFEWLGQSLLNKHWSFLNKIVLLFEQFLIFMPSERELLKRFDQKLRNYQISMLNTDFIARWQILLHFLVITLKFTNFLFNDVIYLFLALGHKLLEYLHYFV